MPIAYESSDAAGAGGAGNTVTVTAPTGIEDDDILIIGGGMGFGIGPSFTGLTSPGFTEIGAYIDSGQLSSGGMLWRRASSESGNYTVTWAGAASTQDRTACVLRISGAETDGNPIHAHAVSAEIDGSATTSDGVCPDVTVTQTCLIVRMGIWEGGFSSMSIARIAGAASTEREDQTFSFTDTAMYTDDALVDSDPGTVTLRMTQGGSTTFGGFCSTIAIAELSVAAAPSGRPHKVSHKLFSFPGLLAGLRI